MPKFYVYRTFAAYVTEVLEIEAVDMLTASDADGADGDLIGVSIGETIKFGTDASTEVFLAAPGILPAVFYVPERR